MLSALAGGLFGERHGEGPPQLLCLHGWGRTHQDWSRMLAEPPLEGWSAVTVDLPGFGATPPPPATWGAREYAQALEPLMAQMDRPVVVVGHSRGGAIGLCLAASHPAQVAGLVLTGAPILQLGSPKRRPPLRYRAVRWAAKAHLVGAARLEAARQRYGSADYRAAVEPMRSILVRVVQEDYRAELEAYQGPLRLVWGAEDRDVPLAVAEAIVAAKSTAVLTCVPGAGHLTPRDCPQALAEAIASIP